MKKLLMLMALLLGVNHGYSDIKSTTGSILFMPNIGDVRANMSEAGLKLGDGEAASANLHATGNALLEHLTVGSNLNTDSDFYVEGSYGLSARVLSSTSSANVTLGNESLVMVDSSANTFQLRLPYAGNVNGRMMMIKKTSRLNSVYVTSGNLTLIDDDTNLELNTINGFAKLYSDGLNWHNLSGEGAKVMASNNLLADIPLDGISGNTAFSYGSMPVSGTYTNFSSDNIGVTGAHSKGSSAVFDGTNHVDFGDSFDVSYPCSFSVWFMLESLPGGATATILSKYNTDGQRSNSVRVKNDQISFYANANGLNSGGSDDVFSTKTFVAGDLNAWFHAAVTVDASGSCHMYINGQLDSTHALTQASILSGTAKFFIGAEENSGSGVPDRFFSGKIDQIKIYNKELSSVEVAILYDGSIN